MVLCTSLQILVQHIKTVLPGLRSRVNAQLVAVAKEHAAFGDVAESKVCHSMNGVVQLPLYAISMVSCLDSFAFACLVDLSF